MKKGFTLVELLGVIILLSVIALITYPNIVGLIESNKEELFNKQIDELKRQSNTWLLYNTDKVRREDMFTYGLTFNELYEQGLTTSATINNPLTNSPLEGCMMLQFKEELNNFEITYDDDCIDDASQLATSIVVKQSSVTIDLGTSSEITSYFTTTFGRLGGTVVCKDASNNTITNTSSLTAGTHTITCTATGNNNTTANAFVNIVIEVVPNEPVLFTNMIPVVYNESTSKWTYADITQEWYDYNNKHWANAVVLKGNPSQTYTVGNDIAMSDIVQMYVWIPRYKYTIFNGNNGSVDEQLINVTFEEGTATTGTVKCYDATSGTAGTTSEVCTDTTQANNAVTNGTSTYTHPAFCLGRKDTDGDCTGTELTGIWVGKFEVSGSASSANLTVLPNVSPLVAKNATAYFSIMGGVANAFNIKDDNNAYADSHMMKNMEWGAVAYLKQSKYGLGTTDVALNNYYDTSQTVYCMTGCGSVVGTTATTTTCTPYDDITGQKASTTGNIYGVYDMNGGTWEYVMGNMVNESGEFYPSNAGTMVLDTKYYDAYTYYASGGISIHGRGKLGDATKETLKTFGSTTGGWYGDYAYFPYSENSWFQRGGLSTSGAKAGVFGFLRNSGGSSGHYSARLVLSRSG